MAKTRVCPSCRERSVQPDLFAGGRVTCGACRTVARYPGSRSRNTQRTEGEGVSRLIVAEEYIENARPLRRRMWSGAGLEPLRPTPTRTTASRSALPAGLVVAAVTGLLLLILHHAGLGPDLGSLSPRETSTAVVIRP